MAGHVQHGLLLEVERAADNALNGVTRYAQALPHIAERAGIGKRGRHHNDAAALIVQALAFPQMLFQHFGDGNGRQVQGHAGFFFVALAHEAEMSAQRIAFSSC